MPRPVTIRDDDLLEAARAVFMARGYQATTAEVAVRAGVSEGSLFKRYKSKDELFRAAMATKFGDPEWIVALERRIVEPDLRVVLRDLAQGMLVFFRELVPVLMMSWSVPGGGERFPCGPGDEPPPIRNLRRVTACFARAKAEGRLGDVQPEALARALMGAVFNFVAFELFSGDRNTKRKSDVFVRNLVDLLWKGAAPAPSEDGT